MKQKIILTFLGAMVAFSAVFFFAPSLATVSAQGSSAPCVGDCAQSGLNTVGSAFPGGAREGFTIRDIVKKIIDWALYIAAIVAVIFIIIGGFTYMTSAGNAGKASTGRATLINALIGLAMIILSYIIVQTVYNFLIDRI